jgi:divalent metal cation (Fe/Co/Zn/Cd) transporter
VGDVRTLKRSRGWGSFAPRVVKGAAGGSLRSAPETSWVGIGLTAATLAICPGLGVAKLRLGEKLGSAATTGEGTQNLLCAYLAAAVLLGLLAHTVFGLW